MNGGGFAAVLFDLDGTLIDTESLALAAGMAAFAALGHAVDAAFMHRLVGRDQPTAEGIIRAALPGIDLGALDRHWDAGFEAALSGGLARKPGVEVVLAAPAPRAIVTSSGRDSAHRKLALAGLSGAFAEVITLADVRAPKPDPEPYLLAAARLCVAPAACLVFEDSEAGAEAAHRAGCTVVQVPDLVPASGRWAHHVAPDLVAGARMAGLL
jgi:beta-phosphoglucomutase-like phosphatase (HAD superfamily)